MFGAKTSPTGKRLDGIDMQSFFATSPETGTQYEFDNSVLAGGDWSGTFDMRDGTFTPEQIQKYLPKDKKDKAGKAIVVADYISSLTDRSCVQEHARLFGIR